jgi:hypothetical protein
MDSVRNGLTKDWLVTDECDPAENGKSMENNMPSGKSFHFNLFKMVILCLVSDAL